MIAPRLVMPVALLLTLSGAAQAMTILGTGTGALLGSDLTDPENNINDNVPSSPNGGSGYNWLTSVASSSNWFTPGNSSLEGALDLFDNKVAAGEAKWYDGGVLPNYRVAVQFALPYVLTRFTVASANDVPNRDPDIWQIQGSNDGATWTPIFIRNNDGVSAWGTNRLQVIRWDGGGVDFATPPAYKWFRFEATSVVSGNDPQLGEIELFGTLAPATTLTWNSSTDNWDTANWLGSPPTFPTAAEDAVVNAGTVTIARVTEAARILQMGGGTVAIGAGNTLQVANLQMSGGSILNLGGTLNASILNASGGTINLNNGGALIGSTGNAGNLNVSGTATLTVASELTIGSFTMAPGSVLNASGLWTASNATIGSTINQTSGTAQLSNVGGAGDLTKNGAGTLVLPSANTYAGLTTVNAGVLRISNATALGGTTNGTSVASGAALEIQGGITSAAEALTLNGTGIGNAGALRNTSGNNTFAGPITLGSAARINSDSGTLTLDVAAGNAITATDLGITFGGAGNVTVNDPISLGTGGITKDGTGTLTLGTANSYSGITTVNAGKLSVRNNTSLGATSGNAVVGTSGQVTLDVGGLNIAEPITINGQNNDGAWGGALRANTGTSTWSGPITLGSDSRISTAGGATFNVTGGVTGNFVFAVNHTGTINFNTSPINIGGSPFYAHSAGTTNLNVASTMGRLEVDYGATVALGLANAVAATAGIQIGGPASGNTGTLNLNGFSQTVAYIQSGTSVVATSQIRSTPPATLTVNQTSGFRTYNGLITGAISLVKDGAGTLVLGNQNTYTGTTTVNGGTLRLGLTAMAGSALWFDATDTDANGVTDSLPNGTAIATWTNKGNLLGVNATQGTANRRPVVTNNSMNGNAVLSFARVSGQEDWLEVNYNNAGLTNVINSPHTLFVVARTSTGPAENPPGTNTSQALLCSPGNHNDIRFTGSLAAGTTGVGAEQWVGSNAATIYSTWAPGGTIHDTTYVLTSRITGSTGAGPSSIQLFVNGIGQATMSDSRAISNSYPYIVRIGAGNTSGNWSWFLNGDIGEALVVSSALGAADRQAVENYLMAKWLGSGSYPATNVLPDTMPITLGPSGTLDLANFSETIGSLAGSGSVLLGAGTLTTGGNGTDTALSGPISGTGGIVKTGAGAWTLSGNSSYQGATAVNQGTLVAGSNNALGAAAGGTTVASGATLAFQGGIAVQDAVAVSGDGVGSSGALRNLAGDNTLTGAVSLGAATRIASDAGTLTFDVGAGNALSGTDVALTFAGAGNAVVADPISLGTGGLTKLGTGTLTLGAPNAYTGNTLVSQGTLALTGGGSIAGSPAIHVALNAILDASGVTGATWSLSSGQTLTGNGTVVGNLDVALNSLISAGTSPGHLLVDGSYTQSGTMLAELGGTAQGITYDWIDVDGLVALGGTIDVNLVNGFIPLAGAYFDILTATAGITNPDLSGVAFDYRDAQTGMAWWASIVPLPGGGEALRLQAAPEPATFVLLTLGGLALLRRRRRR
ncbi:MAG: PEP-CTERM sorting domain-containing protein [Planctomycetes bacterium]|nr:PEP-CTERM sorting domain-containing protein [Planctomycetota bacterium]